MKTRIGKIARLPAHIRDELNHRITQGAVGKNLVAWLNSLPEVQSVMAELYGGAKITHQNLSVWRHSGYSDWAMLRTDRAQWQDLLDHLQELKNQQTQTGTNVTGHVSTLVIFEISQALDKLSRMEDSEERWRIFRTISRAFSRLRMDDCREKRVRIWDLKASRHSNPLHEIPAPSTHKKIIS